MLLLYETPFTVTVLCMETGYKLHHSKCSSIKQRRPFSLSVQAAVTSFSRKLKA